MENECFIEYRVRESNDRFMHHHKQAWNAERSFINTTTLKVENIGDKNSKHGVRCNCTVLHTVI